MKEQAIDSWMETLYSKEPVPGGGGASAVAGSMAAALGGMVANLTTGKKKYAEYQEDIEGILEKTQDYKNAFLRLMEEDAAAFEPLAKAYSLPKSTPEEAAAKEAVMEEALKNASAVPLKIMLTAFDLIDVLDELAVKGSRMALSDVGVALMMDRAALMGASMNVYINTKCMKDRERAVAYETQADELIETGCTRIDAIYERVVGELRGKV